MKIIEPTATLLPIDGIESLKKIEAMARISHRSEDRQTEDSWRRFIQAVVIEHGDWSVVEHVSATVLFRVDRGVTHELVRHRLFSFTQESTRFVRYVEDTALGRGMEFVMPSEMKTPQIQDLWMQQMIEAEQRYNKMIGYNARPQEARSILPNALAATIAVTGNLRNWRHFLLMRTSKETHPDFKRVTIPLLTVFQATFPILYDDIIPETRQIENLQKGR